MEIFIFQMMQSQSRDLRIWLLTDFLRNHRAGEFPESMKLNLMPNSSFLEFFEIILLSIQFEAFV